MMPTGVRYRMIAADLPRSMATVAARPPVAREVEHYKAAIAKVKSLDDFMADGRLVAFALKAHGLADLAFAKAFVRKLLAGGLDSRDALANKLADPRYRDFVQTFNFARYGEIATLAERAQAGTVDKYLRQTLEEEAGAANEGVRLALYFERKAVTVSSPYAVLADPALAQVVRTALGLPSSFAMADIDRQARLIEARIDFADFRSPKRLAAFLDRFTALWELANPSRPPALGAAALYGAAGRIGIDAGLIARLQALRSGRS